MICGRRAEWGAASNFPTPDEWRDDKTCSYCGSLDPAEFFRVIAEGGELGPTDKNYKVYVTGSGLRQSYRDCPDDADCEGPDDCGHWVTRDVDQSKFYFQHLSADEQTKFVTLLNENKVKIGVPGYFYVLPFFCKVADPGV